MKEINKAVGGFTIFLSKQVLVTTLELGHLIRM